jgi:NADPH-dependent 2,4-dienoyl-CoA reductase/sulfur reductase-like enzyme
MRRYSRQVPIESKDVGCRDASGPSAVSQLVAALAVRIPRSAGAESRLLGVDASVRKSKADVVVVGSGGLGAATAYYLAKRGGISVALLDKHDIMVRSEI